MIIAHYFGIFENGTLPPGIPFHLLTRLYLAFAVITSNCSLLLPHPEKVALLINQTREMNPSAEIFLSISGDFPKVSNSPRFYSSLLRLVEDLRLDGVDLDWEDDLDRSSLTDVILNLSSLLHPRGIKLTLAVWPVFQNEYDLPLMRVHLDQINIMSYGEQSDLSMIIDRYVEAGFPLEKIIGGIITEDPYPGGADTDESIAEKVTVIKKRGAAGMMAWRLDNDHTDEKGQPQFKGAYSLYQAVRSL